MTPTPLTRPLIAVLLAAIALAGCGKSDPQPPRTPKPPKPDPTTDAPPKPDVPTAAAPKVVEPFNGKDFTGWKKFGHAVLDKWEVGQPTFAHGKPAADDPPALVQPDPQGVSIYTEAEFGDCLIEMDVMVPAGGNSGIYIMGEYELQLLDDPNADADSPTNMDWGAIARRLAPRAWANKGGGVWQRVVIDFRAPRFDEDDNKTANAKLVKVTINGTVVHENAEIEGPTAGGLYGEEYATGPLYLQGNEGPAAFRNIRVTPR